MTTTPRIRHDLKAQPAEELGIKYFDISDPRSGARMRMYDFEWLIAVQMDGAHGFDDVAAWAHDRLGLQPSADDLEEYARRLRQLGFFELGEAHVATPGPAPAGTGSDHGESAARPSETTPRPSPLPPAARQPSAAARASGFGRAPSPFDRPPNRTTGKVTPLPAPPPSSGWSVGSIVALIVLALMVAGGALYMVYFMPSAAKVTVQTAVPREVVRLYDGNGVVKAAEPRTLSFGEPGKLTDIVAAGTEVKAGAALASLEAFARVEKDLADLKDRASFYEKQVEAARARGNQEEARRNAVKVAEKRQLLGELEARLAKVRLTAPGPGTVSQVLVGAGGMVKPGQPVLQLSDKRPAIDFTLPAAEASVFRAGSAVWLQPARGGAVASGRVLKVEPGPTASVLSVELLDENAAKPADAMRLVKARLTNVVPVPAGAVVKRDGAEVVFVVVGGEAKLRRIAVVDRSPAEVMVASGLSNGDSIITGGAESLQDGQKVTTQ